MAYHRIQEPARLHALIDAILLIEADASLSTLLLRIVETATKLVGAQYGALGVLASAMVLRLGPASEWLVWPIPALLSPFVGVFYPLSTLPSWMRGVGHLLPPSYVFEDMRAVVAGQSIDIATLFISIALAALYVLLACLLFAAVHRYTVRSGLLARYSAESVS